jgi:malate dehydrogenase (oxaloacetate-decarboxylating)
MEIRQTSSSIVIRLELMNSVATFAKVAYLIGNAGGDIVAIDVIRVGRDTVVRDVTVNVINREHGNNISAVLDEHPGIQVVHVSDRTFLLHLGGKIEIVPKVQIKNRDDLSRVYTPHVAEVCKAIQETPAKVYQLTIKRNMVAIVSDGTAVLGLGDIGPNAALPVMEGKSMLFKQFAGIDAFPICLDTKDPDEIVSIVKAIAPVFGGINLEDISSPRCFEIEERLKRELDIPVFHDDQHGTAVVLLAGLLNAVKIVNKRIEDLKVVVIGVGAAGVACTKMLLAVGVKNLLGVTMEGIIHRDNVYDNPAWNWVKEHTNPGNVKGGLAEALSEADVCIGVSGPGILMIEHLKSMGRDPILFALANPDPEIRPEEAGPYVRIMATGRSDYPNQINNVLCFPGIFKGALAVRAHTINEEMKLAAARAIASIIKEDELSEDYIIPSVFNQRVVEAVAEEVAKAAVESGVARREL